MNTHTPAAAEAAAEAASAPDVAPVRVPDDPTIWEVDDALWTLIGPLLVSDKPRKKSGRPRRDDRVIFNGLIWMARTGSQWSQLPRHFGAKSTVHARLQEWAAGGQLERAWAALLRAYDTTAGLDWEWQAADGCLIRAPGGKKGEPKGRLVRLKRPAPTPPTGPNRASNGTG